MGKTRTEVAKRLTEALRDLDRGIIAPKDERLTFGSYLESWLATKKTVVELGYGFAAKPTYGCTSTPA